jgi:hypothetical protein
VNAPGIAVPGVLAHETEFSRAFPAHLRREENSMPVDLRPAIPTLPARQGALNAHRESLVAKLATGITVLTAAIAVLIVAAADVAFAIT